MRFTLGKMFLAVAMLALACAGMTYRNYWWLSGLITLSLTIFGAALLKALVAEGRERVKLLGFCIFGIGYLVLSLTTPWSIGNWLPTNIPLAAVAQGLGVKLEYDIMPSSGRGLGKEFANYVEASTRQVYVGGEFKAFLFIGHCVFSWLFAVLAAWFAGRMYDRRERATKGTT